MSKKKWLRRQQQNQSVPAGQPRPFATFQVRQEAFSGPIPPPAMLAEYDRIVPGVAGRIVAMAESQLAHRQSLERRVISSDIWAARVGQLLAFILGMTAIVGGFRLIELGKDGYGIASIIGAVGGLVGVFIYGRYRQDKERDRKAKGLPPQLQ